MRTVVTRFGSLLSFLVLGVVFLFCTPGVVRPGAPIDPITIRVAFDQFGPPPHYEQLWWERVKQRVEAANPALRVQLMPLAASGEGYRRRIDRMLHDGVVAPDLVREDSFLIGPDAAIGDLAPLDTYLASWRAYTRQWFPAMRRITRFHGHTYGIMNSTDVRLIWYNKRVFKSAGLPVAWQPKSWADILSAAWTIKRKLPHVTPLNVYAGTPMEEASTMQGFEMFLDGTKDPLYNTQTKKWVVSSKGFLATLTMVREVYDPANPLGPPNNVALNPEAYQTVMWRMVPQGKVGIAIDGSYVPGGWYPGGAAPWPQWREAMGVAKMPTQFGQAPSYVTIAGGYAYAINARSRHKDAAFQVLKVANSEDLLTSYDTSTASITPRKDVAAAPSYASAPFNPFFTSLLAVAQFRPNVPAYPRISHQIDVAMEKVMLGMPPTKAMAAYARAVTKIVGRESVEKRL